MNEDLLARHLQAIHDGRMDISAPPSLRERAWAAPESPLLRSWLRQPPNWRLQSIFSATKFIVASVIVALFGSFLLAGVMRGPTDQPIPAALASTSPSAGCAQPLAEPGVYDGINDFEDAGQAYRVVVPNGYAERTPASLIIFLAAGLGTAEGNFGWWRPYLDSAESVFVVVEQRGYLQQETETLIALIDQLEATYCIDRARVYAMGQSSSAGTVKRLACAASDRIGAFFVGVSGFAADCMPERALPVMVMTGDPDRLEVSVSVGHWAEAYGCATDPLVDDLGAGVTRSTYQDCLADIVLYDIEGVGHGLILSECGAGGAADFCYANERFDQLREVERFFAEHPKPAAPAPVTPSVGCDAPLAEPGVYDAINDFEEVDQAYRVVVPEGYADLAPAPLILFPAAHVGQLELSAEMWRPYLEPARSIFVTAEQMTFDHAQPPTLTALLDELAADYCIDARRVHAMGMSSSGAAAARLACTAPDRIASFSAVVGGFFIPGTCSVPLLAVTGETDRTRVGQPVERWTKQNGCDPEPMQEDLGSGVTRSTYQGCPADTVLYDIEGAGHGFIRQACADPPLYCFENDVFDVLREVERFSDEHPLPAE